MNYTIKKIDLIKYLKLSVIVLMVFLLQLNIGSTMRLTFSVLLLVISLFGDIRQAMLILLLLMPIANEISLFNGVSLTVVIVLFNALKCCLTSKVLEIKNGFRKKWYIWAFVLLIYSVIILSFAGTSEQLQYTIKFLAYLVFVEAYLSECINRHKMKGSWVFSSMLRTLGVGIAIALICLIISGGQISNATRLSFGELATTNNTGIQSSFVIIGLLLSRYMKSSKKIDYAIILSCLIVSVATQSRTAIVMLIAAVVIYVLSTIIRGRLLQAFFMTLSLIASFAVLLNIPMVRTYYDSIDNRFQASDISNGRYEIWGKTLAEMGSNKKYILFGAGDYYNLDFTFGKRNESIEAHNFLIETWVIYGIIGSLLLTILLWFYVKEVVFWGIPAEAPLRRCLYVFAPIIILLLGLLYSHHFIGKGNTILFVSSFIPIACTTLNKTGTNKVNGKK